VKRLLAVTAIILIFASGCSTTVDTDYVIKVAGSTGAQFSGSYIVTDANGESTVEAGELRLEILRDGEVVASAETSSGMGVISALTQ
jgi:hypothetical protein